LKLKRRMAAKGKSLRQRKHKPLTRAWLFVRKKVFLRKNLTQFSSLR
jgi:hypothetical protein